MNNLNIKFIIETLNVCDSNVACKNLNRILPIPLKIINNGRFI